MTAKAIVTRTDPMIGQLDIWFGEVGNGLIVQEFGGWQQPRIKTDTEMFAPIVDNNDPEARPSLRIREEQALALMHELLRHFGGTDDTRNLRIDYDAERARVDKLTDHVLNNLGRLVTGLSE